MYIDSILQSKYRDCQNGFLKNDPTMLCTRYFRPKDPNGLMVKGWKKIVHANSNQKGAEVAILKEKWHWVKKLL